MKYTDYSILIGRIWKFSDNINTDLIVPSAYLTEPNPDIIVKHAFEGIRENFSEMVNPGDVIVGGRNFGSGSSREEAVFVVKQLKISLVIAESFSRIYFRNLINNGIPAIEIKNITNLVNEGDKIIINLKKGIIYLLEMEKLPQALSSDIIIDEEIINNPDTENFLKSRGILKNKIMFKPLPQFILNIIEKGGILNVIKNLNQQSNLS